MVVPVLLGGDQSIHAVRYQERTLADPEGLTAVAGRVLAMKSVDSFMYSSHLEKASILGQYPPMLRAEQFQNPPFSLDRKEVDHIRSSTFQSETRFVSGQTYSRNGKDSKRPS